jgi:hypothetical protein
MRPWCRSSVPCDNDSLMCLKLKALCFVEKILKAMMRNDYQHTPKSNRYAILYDFINWMQMYLVKQSDWPVPSSM